MRVRSLALVFAGPISRTGLGRLSRLTSQLGPVKAGSLQRASRGVNSLGGGRAVSEYRELNEARSVLVSVPDDQLRGIVEELAKAVSWKRKTAILCYSPLDSSQFAPLAALGADVGSFDTIPGFDEQVYVIEGSGAALREMRALLQHDLNRVIEIHQGAKQQYLAGVAFASSFITSMVVAAVKSLRAAGIPLKQSQSIAAKLAEKSIKDYLKGGVAGAAAVPGTGMQDLADGMELANPGFAGHFLGSDAEE